MYSNSQKIQMAIVTGLAVLAAIVFGSMLKVHIGNQVNFFSWYNDVEKFGDKCEIAIVNAEPQFSELGQFRYEQMKMPYRNSKNPPKVAPGETIVTRCKINVQNLSFKKFPYISLGPVFGKSRLYLGERLAVETSTNGFIELPLSPSDLALPTLTMTLISTRTIGATAGMSSLRPPFVTDNRTAINGAAYIVRTDYLDQPALRIGLCVAIALALAMLYFSGLKHFDILWLIAFASILIIRDYVDFYTYFHPTNYGLQRLAGVTNFLKYLALCGFHYHLNTRRPLSSFVVSSIVVSAALVCLFILLCSDQIFFDLRLFSKAQAYFGIIALTVTLWHSSRHIGNASKAAIRRIKLYNSLGTFVIALCAVQIYFEDKNAIFLEPLVGISIIFIYTLVLFGGLAKRQYEYFREQRRRLEADRAVGEARAVATTAKMLIHDIRRPFSQLQLFRSGDLNFENPNDIHLFQTKYLPTILEEYERIDGMLIDLMQIGSPRPPRLSEVKLCELFEGIEKRLKANLVEKDVAYHRTSSTTTLMLDRGLLDRALFNVLENALQAVPVRGRLSVEIVEGSKIIEIVIENSGSFVASDERTKIFDTYYTSGKAHGTGLGLAVAKQIIEAHGGTIHCESFPSPMLTRFIITLPNRAKPTKVEDEKSPTTSKTFILDDDELMLLAWRKQGKGFFTSTNVDDLKALINTHTGEKDQIIAILDFHLSDTVTCEDLARWIRHARPQAIIVLFSNIVDFSGEHLFDRVYSKAHLAVSEVTSKLGIL